MYMDCGLVCGRRVCRALWELMQRAGVRGTAVGKSLSKAPPNKTFIIEGVVSFNSVLLMCG